MPVATPKKVLIVRFSSIGDIVLCSPVVRCAKQYWGAEVHFVTKQKYAPVIAASPYIDQIITIKDRVAEVKAELQAAKYDLVIDLHKNIRSQQVRAICKKAAYVTFDKINMQKWLAVHTPVNILPDKHLVDRYFEGLHSTGLRYDGDGLDHHLTDHDIQKAASMVPATYAVISLGATYSTKRPPLEKLVTTVQAMTSHPVLIGGSDVADTASQLQSLIDQQCSNMVGQVSLGVSSALVRSAKYVVTGDSGMMHIAAAHRRPLLVYWGSTHPMLGMYPYYPTDSTTAYYPLVRNLSCQPCSKVGKDVCPKGHFQCMMGLRDSAVKDAVEYMEHSDK